METPSWFFNVIYSPFPIVIDGDTLLISEGFLFNPLQSLWTPFFFLDLVFSICLRPYLNCLDTFLIAQPYFQSPPPNFNRLDNFFLFLDHVFSHAPSILNRHDHPSYSSMLSFQFDPFLHFNRCGLPSYSSILSFQFPHPILIAVNTFHTSQFLFFNSFHI